MNRNLHLLVEKSWIFLFISNDSNSLVLLSSLKNINKFVLISDLLIKIHLYCKWIYDLNLLKLINVLLKYLNLTLSSAGIFDGESHQEVLLGCLMNGQPCLLRADVETTMKKEVQRHSKYVYS